MKKLLPALLFLFYAHSVTAQKPGAAIDVLHYEFGITLSDQNDVIVGDARIRFKMLQAVSRVSFDLLKINAQEKGMKVLSVMQGEQSLNFQQDSTHVIINLTDKPAIGDEKEIQIKYSGIPADGLIIANNKYKHRGFFADHWPDRAHNWLPCVDHPADKATVDFIITAPEHYQVVANGIQTEETSLGNGMKLTRYAETAPLPPKVMVIGVADFAVQLSGMVDCTPVYAWVYPEDRNNGFYDYGQATEILPFYIKNVGPYGYKKLANVQSKTRFGGLENAGAIFYYENSVTGTRKSESLLAHEIAHQWFGDMATETDWPHLWLSEGFATYMTILYMENSYGKDTATKMLIADRKATIAFSKKVKRPVVDKSVTDYMQLLNANSYQKGGWVLHMLRNQLGDSTFWRGIRTYYAKYAGANASSEDLQKVLEEVSGKDLSVFFRQWLYTPGQPDIELSWVYEEARKLTTVTITQKQETEFVFPLEIKVTSSNADDGVLTKSVQVSKKVSTFTIPVQGAPKTIELDPAVKLLFEGTVKKG